MSFGWFGAWGSCVCVCEWQPLDKLDHWLQANLATDHIPLFGERLDEEAFPLIKEGCKTIWFHVCQGSTYKKKLLRALKLLLITTLTKCLREGKMYSIKGTFPHSFQ